MGFCVESDSLITGIVTGHIAFPAINAHVIIYNRHHLLEMSRKAHSHHALKYNGCISLWLGLQTLGRILFLA